MAVRAVFTVTLSLLVTAIFVATAADAMQVAQKTKTFSNLEVEQRLKELGFEPGPIDGTFDAKTKPALRAFQKKAGISETGKVDDATMAELVASTEAKLLHSLPPALLPPTTAPENFGTKIILRHAAEKPGAMLLIIPHKGGYQHKLQFLGLTEDGRAHVESTVWTHGAIHEIDGPLTLAGFQFLPEDGAPMVFRVDSKKGYVFVSGQGQITPPNGATMIFGPYQQGIAIGKPPEAPVMIMK